MAQQLPITSTVQDAQRAAIDDVNRWRGHCIELFARAEDSLARAVGGQPGLKAAASLCARIDALKTAASSAKLVKTLDELRVMAEQRNMLAHATSKVWIKDHRSWLWAYRFTPSGKGKTEQRGYWTKDDAVAFENRLRRAVQSLSDQLARPVAREGRREEKIAWPPSLRVSTPTG